MSVFALPKFEEHEWRKMKKATILFNLIPVVFNYCTESMALPFRGIAVIRNWKMKAEIALFILLQTFVIKLYDFHFNRNFD